MTFQFQTETGVVLTLRQPTLVDLATAGLLSALLAQAFNTYEPVDDSPWPGIPAGHPLAAAADELYHQQETTDISCEMTQLVRMLLVDPVSFDPNRLTTDELMRLFFLVCLPFCPSPFAALVTHEGSSNLLLAAARRYKRRPSEFLTGDPHANLLDLFLALGSHDAKAPVDDFLEV